MKILPKEFYERDPALVAKDLLGRILLRRLDSEVLSGRIVETEAYYGKSDPASRAYKGRKLFNELMFMDVGRVFIYMVHGHWLLNIVAHSRRRVGAVLIRAIEPLQGTKIMQRNRKVRDVYDLTSGPGKLTKALAITKKLNGVRVTRKNGQLRIIEGEGEDFEIHSSRRIGVKADLPQKLRFVINGNRFVSRIS